MRSLFVAFLAFAAQAPQVADRDAPSSVAVTSDQEPGVRLVVSGRVFGPDGTTPLPGVSLYVYQTDQTGYYSTPVNDSRNPRLRGYLRTDADGRYVFTTIKPAPYPNERIPAHIHYVVTAPGYREKIFEIVFADDRLVDARIRADAAKEDSVYSIRPLTRNREGVLQCVQGIRLKK
jgi:protocatechuate 3,4-dioxygenase beta subunit